MHMDFKRKSGIILELKFDSNVLLLVSFRATHYIEIKIFSIMILLIFGVNDNLRKISHYKQFLDGPQAPDPENNCHQHLVSITPDKQRGEK